MTLDRQWRHWKESHITAMRADNNCLYVHKDLDIRLCPKNGSKTLKHLLYVADHRRHIIPNNPKYRMSALMFPDYNLELYEGWTRNTSGRPRFTFSQMRVMAIAKHADFMDFPFRPNSIRVAVKRDPVERFVSTLKYLNDIPPDNYGEFKGVYKSTPLFADPVFYDKMTVDEILTGLEEKTIHNLHWTPQSYWMGNESKYDKIFYLKDTKVLLHMIMKHNKDRRIQTLYDLVVNIHQNKSTEKTKQRNVELTDSQIKRVKKIYEEDYDNGWC